MSRKARRWPSMFNCFNEGMISGQQKNVAIPHALGYKCISCSYVMCWMRKQSHFCLCGKDAVFDTCKAAKICLRIYFSLQFQQKCRHIYCTCDSACSVFQQWMASVMRVCIRVYSLVCSYMCILQYIYMCVYE